MSTRHDTMMKPAIEGLLGRTESKFTLVTVAAQRARQINSYFGQLGEGLGLMIPPQVTSVARKPLSIAFEELAADKITFRPREEIEAEMAELAAAAQAAVADMDDLGELGTDGAEGVGDPE